MVIRKEFKPTLSQAELDIIDNDKTIISKVLNTLTKDKDILILKRIIENQQKEIESLKNQKKEK